MAVAAERCSELLERAVSKQKAVQRLRNGRRVRKMHRKDRKYHFSRRCAICKELVYGTRISLDNHEQNCMKKRYGGVKPLPK